MGHGCPGGVVPWWKLPRMVPLIPAFVGAYAHGGMCQVVDRGQGCTVGVHRGRVALMTTYLFKVTCTDGKVREVKTTADRLPQATSNMLGALINAGHMPVIGWTHRILSGS